LGLVGRIDQHQPAADALAPDVGWQQRFHRRVAIALVYRDAWIPGEIGLQHGGFIRLQFAAGDPVGFAQRVCKQPGRTGIRVFAMGGATGADRLEIACDPWIHRRLCEQPRHPILRLAGALGRFGVERIQPAPGMGVEGETRCRLARQRLA